MSTRARLGAVLLGVFTTAFFVALLTTAPALEGRAALDGTPAGTSDSPDPSITEARVRDLTAELRKPPHWSERNAALRFFSHLVTPYAEPHLLAIRAIGKTGLPSASIPLVEVLRDPSSPYRADAVIELSRVPSEEALRALIEALDDPDDDLRRVAARAIGAIVAGDDVSASPATAELAEQRLTRLLREDPAPRVRVAALHGLVGIGSDRALVAAFSMGSNDYHDLVRCGALMRTQDFLVAGHVVDRRQVQTFIRGSISQTPPSLGLFTRAYQAYASYTEIGDQTDCIDVHPMALQQLAKMRDPDALALLLGEVSHPDPAVRQSSVESLAEFRGNEQAFLAVAHAAAHDPVAGVRRTAIDALTEFEEAQSDPRLVEVLQRGEPFDRRAAAAALGDLLGPSSELIDAFADPAVEVRKEAEAAFIARRALLSKLEEILAQARDPAVPHASEAHREARIRKIEDRLRKWRNWRPEAERSLAAGLSSADPRVRLRSARMLARFEDDLSLELLLEALRSARHPESETAALSLGLRADPRARLALEDAARSSDPALAVAAIRALFDIGEPESLPLLRSLQSSSDDDRIEEASRLAIEMLEVSGTTGSPSPLPGSS